MTHRFTAHSVGARGLPLRLVCALGLAAVVVAGCSSRRPLEVWRQEVTRFVVMEGNGDPDCLRDTSDFRSRRTVRGAPMAISTIEALDKRSRDARGVLVGECQVNGKPWYVFLVAVVDFDWRTRSDVESVRPVAMTADAEGLQWFMPQSDDRAPAAYLEASQRQKAALATRFAVFPGPRDVFEMQARGPEVTIVERRSGARWTLHIPTITNEQPPEPTAVAATRPSR